MINNHVSGYKDTVLKADTVDASIYVCMLSGTIMYGHDYTAAMVLGWGASNRKCTVFQQYVVMGLISFLIMLWRC